MLAAAITATADMIVTADLDDFPSDLLAVHGIDAHSPDDVVHRFTVDDIDVVAEVIDQQAADLRDPPMTTAQLLDELAAVGLDGYRATAA